MKDRSVFKDYRDDNVAHLKKCFEQDVEFSKLPRLFKKEQDEFKQVKECLFVHYEKIINIFAFYVGISSYPTISLNDFTSFAHYTKILDNKYINLASLDLLFVATNVSANKFINSAERDFNRYEFIEFIVRAAIFRFKDTKLADTTVKAINMLLEDMIFPFAKSMNGEYFRKYFCYNCDVNEILKKNEHQLRKLYTAFTHSNKQYIRIEEAQAFVRQIGLNISEMMVGAIYAESIMTIVDTISEREKPN